MPFSDFYGNSDVVDRLREMLARKRFPQAVILTGPQGSGVLSSMSEANCFIVLKHDAGNIDAGDSVDILPFDGLI